MSVLWWPQATKEHGTWYLVLGTWYLVLGPLERGREAARTHGTRPLRAGSMKLAGGLPTATLLLEEAPEGFGEGAFAEIGLVEEGVDAGGGGSFSV